MYTILARRHLERRAMQLALSGLTALRVWRAIRAGKLPGVRVGARVDLPLDTKGV